MGCVPFGLPALYALCGAQATQSRGRQGHPQLSKKGQPQAIEARQRLKRSANRLPISYATCAVICSSAALPAVIALVLLIYLLFVFSGNTTG